jgi:hypothetical protein
MSAPEGSTADSAGSSQPDDVDVSEVFARVRAEVSRSTRYGSAPDDPASAWAAARSAAERFAAVTADRPLVRRPGLRGALEHGLKSVLRKLMRWYVEPVAAEQRAFNDALLQLLDELAERVRRLERDDRA